MVANSETFSGGLDDVRAFCAVIDLGTVTRAAETLRETKGSVSRRISRLERALGATLLARHPRAVSPTVEGLAFYAKAQESLALLDEAAETARDARNAPSGHLRVTTSMDFGIEVMPEIVVSFRRLYPQITVELLATDTRLDLATNRIDLALRFAGLDDGDTGYRAALMLEVGIGLYAAPKYLADRPAPVTIDGLTGHDVVLSRERIGATALSLTNRDGRKEQMVARPAIRAGDFATVLRLTLAGGGIGHIPSLVAARAVQSGELVRVLPDWASDGGALRAVTLAGRELPARVRLFRDHVRGELTRRFTIESVRR
jgi:DNA-binding transcriptional LysR family regulator